VYDKTCNARTKLRIASAFVQLSSHPERPETCVSLFSAGDWEIRMFAGSTAESDGSPLFWLELFDHRANASLDSASCHRIEDAVAVFDEFFAHATHLNDTRDDADLK
jgi:hypothetical protein